MASSYRERVYLGIDEEGHEIIKWASGDILLGCLATADQQLFDGGWGDFFINCAAFLPCCQISDAHYLEQRLRFVRESGEPFFPHEHVDVFR